MNISTEFMLSIFSASIGVVGTWIGFQKFTSDAKDRELRDVKQIVIMEHDLESLRKDVTVLKATVDALFDKFDQRCDQLERQHVETQMGLKAILNRQCQDDGKQK